MTSIARTSATLSLVSLFALLVTACGSSVADEDHSSGDQGGAGAGSQIAGGNNPGGGSSVGGGNVGGGNVGGGNVGGGTVNPQPGVAENIELAIYSDGWGTLLATQTMATEGTVTIDVVETNPYSNPPQYYIYAKADGFFTELYHCSKGGSITVDLDAVADSPDAVAGVIFTRQSYFSDNYFSNATIQVSGPAVNTTLTTDNQGRYGLQNLPAGNYSFSFTYQGEPFTLNLSNTSSGVDYQDLAFDEPMQAS